MCAGSSTRPAADDPFDGDAAFQAHRCEDCPPEVDALPIGEVVQFHGCQTAKLEGRRALASVKNPGSERDVGPWIKALLWSPLRSLRDGSTIHHVASSECEYRLYMSRWLRRKHCRLCPGKVPSLQFSEAVLAWFRSQQDGQSLQDGQLLQDGQSLQDGRLHYTRFGRRHGWSMHLVACWHR